MCVIGEVYRTSCNHPELLINLIGYLKGFPQTCSVLHGSLVQSLLSKPPYIPLTSAPLQYKTSNNCSSSMGKATQSLFQYETVSSPKHHSRQRAFHSFLKLRTHCLRNVCGASFWNRSIHFPFCGSWKSACCFH